MKGKSFRLSIVPFLIAIAAVCTTPAQAQVAWVQQSYYAFEATNNTGSTAQQFKLTVKGIGMWAVDQSQCLSNDFSHYSISEDQNGVTFTWSQGSIAAGDDAQFAIVINQQVSLDDCNMTWADSSGNALGHIDAVWQDWTTSGSSVYGTLNNRSTSTLYVRRAVGYSTDSTSLTELIAMDLPPNPTVLDPENFAAMSSGDSLTYDYSPYYLTNRSNFMFYEVYTDSTATSPIAGFKTAAVTTIPAGGISFASNIDIDNHIIQSVTEDPYEIISARVIADSYEDLQLDWVAINIDESGCSADITVKVWNDVNNNGQVDTCVDQLLGSSVVTAGTDQATVQISPSVTIPKGTEMNLIVSYNLPASVSAGADLSGSLGDACAMGLTTGLRVPRTGDNIDGASIMVTPPPTSIGSAKQLPLDPTSGETDVVWLQDMRVTAYFDDMVYIEDKDRICGIGVHVGDGDHPDFVEGMKASVMGRVKLDEDGVEAILEPINGVIGDVLTPLTPLLMTNKAAGGGAFGIQPAVLDNAYTGSYAFGLNNIGKLIKIYGQVTGTESFDDGDDETINITWIDDGSALQDGAFGHSGIAVFMPEDWDGTPLTGMVTATGIIRAVESPGEDIIRVLFPRSMADIQ